jgi:hypothetical protein
MALDSGVVDSVINANFKAVAEMTAVNTNYLQTMQNRAFEDALQDQRNSRLLSTSVIGSLCKRIVESDITEAVANAKNASADLPIRQVELGSASAQSESLQVTLAAIAQVLTKLAQSTPPQTAVPAGA